MRELAPQAVPGRLIVIGGHSRGVGKTALVEEWLRQWRGGPICAVKISAHRHAAANGQAPVIEEASEASPMSQTGRYLAAGAGRAWLCRCPSERMADAARFVMALRDQGWGVVVESNRIVRYLRPDLTFFVVSDRTTDWKASSSACLRRADALVLSAGTAQVPARASRHGWAAALGRPVLRFDRGWAVGVAPWIRSPGPRFDGLTFPPPSPVPRA